MTEIHKGQPFDIDGRLYVQTHRSEHRPYFVCKYMPDKPSSNGPLGRIDPGLPWSIWISKRDMPTPLCVGWFHRQGDALTAVHLMNCQAAGYRLVAPVTPSRLLQVAPSTGGAYRGPKVLYSLASGADPNTLHIVSDGCGMIVSGDTAASIEGNEWVEVAFAGPFHEMCCDCVAAINQRDLNY